MATRKPEPVCTDPKIFVGQLFPEVTREEVRAVFSKYGTVKKCNIISFPDGRSRGCAMVEFEKWAEAEEAVEKENGTTNLGGTKPMVVKFADPPKRGDGPVVGIAPKKLFIGQVPTGVTEDDLREVFSTYGTVVEVHMLQRQSQNPAGCAFVTYSKWAEAESAIEGLDAKYKFPQARGPLVVKFADFKTEPARHGEKRAFGEDREGPSKRPYLGTGTGMGGGSYGGMQSMGMGGYSDMMGMGMMGGMMPAAMMGMGMNNPMAMNAFGMGGPMSAMGMGVNGMGGMGMGPMGPGMGSMSSQGMGSQGMGYGSMTMGSGAAGQMGPQGSGSQAAGASPFGMGSSPPAPKSTATPAELEAARPWKLFIGQLPFETSEGDLWQLFRPYGEILEAIILRNTEGRSKGCAFVSYRTQAMADLAIQRLNGTPIPHDPRGKNLVVKLAGAPR